MAVLYIVLERGNTEKTVVSFCLTFVVCVEYCLTFVVCVEYCLAFVVCVEKLREKKSERVVLNTVFV